MNSCLETIWTTDAIKIAFQSGLATCYQEDFLFCCCLSPIVFSIVVRGGAWSTHCFIWEVIGARGERWSRAGLSLVVWIYFNSPLHYQSFFLKSSCVQLFIGAGDNVHLQNHSSFTPVVHHGVTFQCLFLTVDSLNVRGVIGLKKTHPQQFSAKVK